ncbi:MAG: protein phosphatase 2C domain-containing protein [Candidatus Nealsonbacteria bacterium]|nr:protein phosphatase 2C domain-containing protein [Candidatus Nealsonbacteria bacterium]
MSFQSKIFQLAKDTEHPEQCQDAFGIDPARAIAVVADGVASAIFSRRWAEILTESVAAEPPDPDDKEGFAQWLAELRKTWSESIDTSALAWFQKAKLPLGAFSTLLWIRLSPIEDDGPGTFGAYRLRAFAVGDSCLLHVRHGEILRMFPIEKSEEFEADPVVLGSVDLNRDALVEFRSIDEVCYPDDLLVLCTDAIADWALRGIESGNPPSWDRLWEIAGEDWQQEIAELRGQREMRYDDATLMLLKVAEQGVEIGSPEVSCSTGQIGELPPQHEAASEDWKEKLKSASEQVADGLDKASGHLARGWKKWKRKAVEKYREKFNPDDK